MSRTRSRVKTRPATRCSSPEVDADAQVENEVLKWIGQAKALEAAGGLRKHHLVPSSYLRRWEHGGLLRVVDIGSKATYCAAAAMAARETDFYRLDADSVDPAMLPPLLFEVMLSKIEGDAAPAFEAAIDGGQEALTPDLALSLATFVAFQLARGRHFRAGVQSMVNQTYTEMYRGVVENAVEAPLPAGRDESEFSAMQALGAGLRSGEIVVQEPQAKVVAMVGEAAKIFLPWLSLCRWHVVPTVSELITTDEPVLLLGGPGWPRAQRPGIGSARVIAMPLAPHRLLVLTRTAHWLDDDRFRQALTSDETEAINLELLATAHRWQFSRPVRGPLLPPLPPPVPAMLMERDIGVADEPSHRLLRYFTPSRWLYAGRVPWPVERWWRESTDAGSPDVWWPRGVEAMIKD